MMVVMAFLAGVVAGACAWAMYGAAVLAWLDRGSDK